MLPTGCHVNDVAVLLNERLCCVLPGINVSICHFRVTISLVGLSRVKVSVRITVKPWFHVKIKLF